MRKRNICRVRERAHSPYAHGRAVHEGWTGGPWCHCDVSSLCIAISEADSEARGRSGLGRHMALEGDEAVGHGGSRGCATANEGGDGGPAGATAQRSTSGSRGVEDSRRQGLVARRRPCSAGRSRAARCRVRQCRGWWAG